MALFVWMKGEFFSSGAGSGSQTVSPLTIQAGTGAANLSIENRSPQGVLQYVMRARLAIPVGGGEYKLHQPELQFYTANGQSILVKSQTGDVVIGSTGGGGAGMGQFDNFGNPYLRKGTLTGDVTITTGPLASFHPGVTTRQPGQIQMKLGRPLHFDYQQGLLTSRGTVKVRGDQLQFDGSDLTVEINSANKTLEDLQIARGNRLVISGLFQKNSGAAPANPATQSANTTGATTRIAARLTTYALTFGRHVDVALGAQTLQANRLRLYFQTSAKAPDTAGTGTVNPGTPSPNTVVTSTPAKPPAAANKAENPPLVIHWTGPLVLRPTRHAPVPLSGGRDVFLRATGTTGRPVIMHDGPTRSGAAAEVTYDSALQRVTMRAGHAIPVKLSDAATGDITCATLNYSNLTHQARLTGPGSFKMTGTAAKQNPWLGSWSTRLDVQLAPAQKNISSTGPAIGQGKLAVKTIVMTGDTILHNAQTTLRAHTFTARFVQTTTKNATSALRLFSADGHVRILSANIGLPVADANGLACEHLVLTTHRPAAGGPPVPYQLQAHNRVALIFYQKPAQAGAAPEKFNISGGHLLAMLVGAKKSRALKTSGSDDLGGRYTVSRFRIWDHTVVHIYNIGKPIKAVAYQVSGDRRTGTATLQSDNTGKQTAAIFQGADWLKGQTIKLQRAAQRVTVPGPGELSMPQSSKAAEPRVVVSWQTRMQYSAKTRQATLAGNVLAKLVGRPEQHSSLTAPTMLIHFQRRKTDRNALKLAQLLASGPASRNTVIARDVSYSKTGILQTRMRLQCPQLAYNAVQGLLKIPASGQMSLEDYRPPTSPDTAQQRGQSAFSWNKSLTYHANTGLVKLLGHVRLVFHPVKPIPLPGAQPATQPGTGKAPANRMADLVLLDAGELLAQLNHTGPAAKNGVDLGMGGPTRLKSVTANNAALQVSGLKLAADMLKFNATEELAQAYGSNGRNAILSDVTGNIHAQARRIIWNLTKNKNSITLIQPTGTANLP